MFSSESQRLMVAIEAGLTLAFVIQMKTSFPKSLIKLLTKVSMPNLLPKINSKIKLP
jgi:hypothetical protein